MQRAAENRLPGDQEVPHLTARFETSKGTDKHNAFLGLSFS